MTHPQSSWAALVGSYHRAFAKLDGATQSWLPGLAARFVFAAVIFGYYWNAALTKLDGGLFSLSVGAYAQIIPPVIEAAGYDPSAVSLPWALLVYAGTYGEFALPVLVVIGLLGRLSALGMIGFIAVQSYVDIAFHGADATAIGSWFDRFPAALILDQRTLWVFLLMVLVLKGPGLISVDGMISRFIKSR
jgi:putative oxidoreductase